MKPTAILLITGLFLYTTLTAQQDNGLLEIPATQAVKGKKHINFFIISKRKKGKLDLATRYNVLRTKLRSLFRKDFVAIVARDAPAMSQHVCKILDKKKANLGTIWFDSHGQYKKGYSLFFIGIDEISYYTLRDSLAQLPFRDLSKYADAGTKTVIGSCYGGATYERLAIDYSKITRMNGDSLMISLGRHIQHGVVYGSESWVMSKPGLFWRRPAAGGNPGRKLFLDICYEPAWKNVGIWNQYDVNADKFNSINTITMDGNGNLLIRGLPYTREKKVNLPIQEKMKKLQPGLYK